MSLGESQGGLPPDRVVEDEEQILEDCERVILAFHDPQPGAMVRVSLAPCSPFSVTPELMRASARLGREHGVRLHTHLAETLDEERFCVERFQRRPLEYAEDLGWTGDDVWFAHAVHVRAEEAWRMGRTRTGVAHCPTSNMRLGSGIAPVGAYLQAGVPVGLGVDGSASNDSSHMLAEARQAMLLARLAEWNEPKPEFLPGRLALELATRGGARVLGRPDLGSLEPGQCADFIGVNLDRLEFAGALHDPVAALVFCSPARVDHAFVHGRAVVRDGRLVHVDERRLTADHNRAARRLAEGE
jgi:cytosine/adenosine deaminase-related metal-dependent hydrolase